MYFFMGIGSIISTAIINKFETKKCLLMGGTGNVAWILSTLLAVFNQELEHEIGIPDAIIYSGLFIAASINGFTVGIMWTSAN